MNGAARPKIAAAGVAFLCVGALLLAAFRGGAAAVPGAMLMGSGILLLGYGLGPLFAGAAGLAVLACVAFLWARGWLAPWGAVSAAALAAAAMLFPRLLAESGEGEERAFVLQHAPLAAEREALRARLEDLRARARRIEREGRETDALFHAGREIGKLLSLADTLEFSREILHDTLKQPSGPALPAFIVALADEERPALRVEVAEGIDDAQAAALGNGGEGNVFYRWLRGSLEPVQVRSAAAEPGLKGSALPPGLRGLLSVPLAIEGRAIGWVVVFDLGGGPLAEGDVSNLGILCSQIAIGLEKALLYDRLQRLSVTDGLTGLTVHRHFQSRLDEEIKRSERYREPLSLVMADIDHFKEFNDTWGHLAGDQVLKAVAGAMRLGLGVSEMAVRYGGEEFVLVLPKTPKAAALERAEALREAVRALKVEVEGETLNVTVSLGVASYPGDAMTKPGLIDAADGALYQSKKNGRDRVSAAPPLDSEAPPS